MRELIMTLLIALISGVIVYYGSSLSFPLLVICLCIPIYIIMKINESIKKINNENS
ncbi:putative membrane protein [Bacillus atrophaeus subsp. globigii]|uniref:Uncharacterized protein n=1 Tax=Bacillus atrophaeus (strain 1942) TaxID=720555 RepID=A0ABM5LXH5_BACA1|nr:hypothetical protein BATR1942_07255 [Bacillus atrophaeus 1942]AIK47043.1 putative membrane protein [Bacillus atrophaeus subsp. globigii]EIM11639.1 hypothetical protein UY9_06112 [Bacillus atrophaeus C89]KFK83775.1 putative membrane protein [Bacillus atrophaeus]